jgi:hypothetical protein
MNKVNILGILSPVFLILSFVFRFLASYKGKGRKDILFMGLMLVAFSLSIVFFILWALLS